MGLMPWGKQHRNEAPSETAESATRHDRDAALAKVKTIITADIRESVTEAVANRNAEARKLRENLRGLSTAVEDCVMNLLKGQELEISPAEVARSSANAARIAAERLLYCHHDRKPDKAVALIGDFVRELPPGAKGALADLANHVVFANPEFDRDHGFVTPSTEVFEEIALNPDITFDSLVLRIYPPSSPEKKN